VNHSGSILTFSSRTHRMHSFSLSLITRRHLLQYHIPIAQFVGGD